MPLPYLSASFRTPLPPAVLTLSSDAKSYFSSLLQSALFSVLSSVSGPHIQYFPPAPLYLVPSGRSYVVLPFPLAAVTFVSVTSVVPLAALGLPIFHPYTSLVLPPYPLFPPPPSLGISHQPIPPRKPPPLAPAFDIASKDEYAVAWTGCGRSGC